MAELLKPTDTLAQGYPKINTAIEQAEQALITSDNAIDTANSSMAVSNQALANSQSTQEQLNQIVVDGDSSVEAAQARVNADNTVTYATLKERLDTENQGLSSQLANITRAVPDAYNVKGFGAKGDGVSDDTDAIQAAIDYVTQNGGGTVYFPIGTYRITKPLNVTASLSDPMRRHGLTLKGASNPAKDANRGSRIIAETGAGYAAAEVIDVVGFMLDEIGIECTTSTIGIILSRGSDYNNAVHCKLRNSYIYLSSNPAANNGLGTIGIINNQAEECEYISIDVRANLPYVGADKNVITRENVGTDGLPNRTQTTFTPASYYGVKMATTYVSNIIFNFVGSCRLFAYDHISPNMLFGRIFNVNLNNIFMKRINTGIAQGNYDYCFEFDYIDTFSWNGVIGADCLFLAKNSMHKVNIDCLLSSGAEFSMGLVNSEMVFLEPTSQYRVVSQCNIRIRGAANKSLFKYIRGVSSGRYRFNFVNTTICTDSDLKYLDKTSAGMFTYGDSTTIIFNGFKISYGNNIQKMTLRTNIGAPGTATEFLEFNYPVITAGANEGLSCLLNIKGMIDCTNSVGDAMLPVDIILQISSMPNINAYRVTTAYTKGTSISGNTAGNSITDIELSYIVDDAKGNIKFLLKTIGTGSAGSVFKGDIIAMYSRPYLWGPVITPSALTMTEWQGSRLI